MVETSICIICGLIGFISTIITIVLGIIVISKYFKYKTNILLSVGLSFILIWSAWWPSTVSYIPFLMTGNGLSFQQYIFLGNFFLPFGLIAWSFSIFELLNIKGNAKKAGFILIIIYSVIFEIAVIYYVFHPTELGYLRNPLVPIYDISFYALMMPIIAFFAISGLLFSRESFKSQNLEIRLKGKFLMTGFLIIIVGVISEILTTGDLLLLVSRIIIICGVISLYIGFTLPKMIKNIFIR